MLCSCDDAYSDLFNSIIKLIQSRFNYKGSEETMGNSASTESDLTKEKAFIQSLGDRFPLGDSGLRKFVWCYQNLVVGAQPPAGIDDSPLQCLGTWSSVYGLYESTSYVDPLPPAQKLTEALKIVEQHIFTPGLGTCLIERALCLGLSKQTQITNTCSVEFPKRPMSMEETLAWKTNYFSISSIMNQGPSNYPLEDFLEGISVSCGRRGSRAALTKLFMISCKNESKTANVSDVICTAYCITLAGSYLKNVSIDATNTDWKYFLPQKTEKDTKAMVQSLIDSASKQRLSVGSFSGGNFDSDNNASVSLDEFVEWAETTAPLISSALPTFLHVLFSYFVPTKAFTKGNDKEPRFPFGVTPLWIPSLTVETKESVTSPASSMIVDPSTCMFDLFALSCTSLPLASGRWHRLFSSEANGLSCNRLMHSILGYGGPTLILIRAKNNLGTFGAYTFTSWTHESGAFYGNSDCYLFRLGPDPFALYRPKGSGVMSMDTEQTGSKDETRNYQYFNPEARSKGYDGLAHGIGFGGTPEKPRLYIDEVLDGSCAQSDDLTFENGPLLSGTPSNGSFEVEAIEAWGVGSSQQITDALYTRDGQREDAAKKIRQAMKGAKGQFLEDFQSGLAGNKLFQHRDQIRGRDGDCGLESNGGDQKDK